MTGQFPDTVRYAGREYDITAVDGVGLFDPVAHGLTPTMLSTACWRVHLHVRRWQQRLLAEPIGFTGRLLVGTRRVFNRGRLTAEYDRSEAMAQVRHRLAEPRMSPHDVPIDDDSVSAFVTGAFSQSCDYSWPRLD